MTTTAWSGEEWQIYCQELFAQRHGAEYQAVPDTVRGDWGIEGFTSDGTTYQCYAPEEPLTSAQLYEKHRDKLTADLSKLCTNAREIAALIEPNKVRCWVLVVPRVEDKAILKHAARKAKEVRARNIDGISDEFLVRVLTAEAFPAERRGLGDAIPLALPEIGDVSEDQVAEFAATEDLSTDALDAKLLKLMTSDERIDQLRKEMLRLYIVGAELDHWVRRHHPALWDAWQHARHGVKRTLKMSEFTSSEPPGARVETIRDNLREAVQESVPALIASDATSLAWGTIAEWLVECPLDFGELDYG